MCVQIFVHVSSGACVSFCLYMSSILRNVHTIGHATWRYMKVGYKEERRKLWIKKCVVVVTQTEDSLEITNSLLSACSSLSGGEYYFIFFPSTSLQSLLRFAHHFRQEAISLLYRNISATCPLCARLLLASNLFWDLSSYVNKFVARLKVNVLDGSSCVCIDGEAHPCVCVCVCVCLCIIPWPAVNAVKLCRSEIFTRLP